MKKKIVAWLKKALGLYTMDELQKLVKPCPICNGPAILIEIKYAHYYVDDPPSTYRYTVECADFEDHGLWQLPRKCHFHHGHDLKEFRTPLEAVKHWNEVVVPIALSAKRAMERYQAATKDEN